MAQAAQPVARWCEPLLFGLWEMRRAQVDMSANSHGLELHERTLRERGQRTRQGKSGFTSD